MPVPAFFGRGEPADYQPTKLIVGQGFQRYLSVTAHYIWATSISTLQINAGQYRSDIDGLRAIAVTGVVLFHAAPKICRSGFVGVDIFFVISGYLIGGIVYSAALSGRFSFVNFYARRARRILPALITVIVFNGLVGLLFFDSRELLEYSRQSIMALFGLSNIFFNERAEYFSRNSTYEPLLMTWSLGVEEQFYVLFPFFSLFLVKFGVRRRVALVACAIGVLFCLSLYMTTYYPVSAFYLIPSRAWEILAGVALGIIHRHEQKRTEIPRYFENFAAFFGFAAVVASLFLFDDQTSFPGYAALLPVIGTALLIHTRNASLNGHLLGAAPLVFIGRISYSWYLWHWPLMALARRASDVPPSTSQMLLVALCSLAMGMISWRFIERCFREQRSRDSTTLMRYAVSLALVALPLVLVKLNGGLPARLPTQVAAVENTLLEGHGDCISPIGTISLPDGSSCAPQGATIALFGDSHASALGRGLIDAAQARGLRVRQLSKSACPPLPGFSRRLAKRPRHAEECAKFQMAALGAILDDPAIDTLVVASAWPTLEDAGFVRAPTKGDPLPVTATTALREGLGALAKMAAGRGKVLVLVGDIASLDFDPPAHMVGEAMPLRRLLGRLFDGSRRVPRSPVGLEHVNHKFVGTRDQVLSIARSLPSVIYFDPYLQLCDQRGCSYAHGNRPYYYDSHHLSAVGSRMINWTTVLDEAARHLRPT